MKKIIIILAILITPYTVSAQQYITEQLIFNLDFPVAFTFLPNNNVIITQKLGLVKIYTLNNVQVSTFWNFTDSINSIGDGGVLGICLDPNFNSNHYVYIYYTNRPDSSIKIVRLTENNNIGINPYIIFRHGRYFGNAHIGGNIRFGPLNKLYTTIGDFNNGANSQLLTNPRGKILRINSDGSIPMDNPFYDDGNPETGNDDRIWAYGLRNSFDFCFSPINDSLYASENGNLQADEANFIRKGKNYGWPYCEGFCSPYNPLYKQPMTVWPNMIFGAGMAPTGIMIYNGSQMPELYGKMIVASSKDAGSGTHHVIYKCTLNASADSSIYNDTLVRQGIVTTLLQGTDGYIYALYLGYLTNGGGLLRVKPNPFGIINNNNPVSFSLEQNYPNPFNPSTRIKYSIPSASYVELKIFNALGLEIKTLIDKKELAGNYEVEWDASDYPSGLYLYNLDAGDFSETKKMIFLK